MKRYKHGLIVGKFSPLHKGHEYLIEQAETQCEVLSIVSWSNPEFPGCEARKRETWLRKLFPAHFVYVLDPDRDDPRWMDLGMPLNSASDQPDIVQQSFAAKICKRLLHAPLDVVFSSESYGDSFARYLSQFFSSPIQHEKIDGDRSAVPISGTKIRGDVHRHRQWLSPLVYRDFVKSLCFLGAESTGKSTITKSLALEFQTQLVEEYGRTLWEERRGQLDFEDLLKIAEVHVAEEERRRDLCNKYLIVDTSPLTTLFYSQATFGRADRRLEELAKRRYDHVYLCMTDIPLVQDGTRQDEIFRQKQHEWYLRELAVRKIPYTELSGGNEERMSIVRKTLEVV